MRLKHYVLTSSNPMHWIALSDELAEATRLCSPTYGVEFLEQHQDVIRGHDGLVPVFFDQQIEKWIHHLGVPICFPAADVRAAIEDKCEAVRLAQDAGLDLAPTCLAKLTGYAQLKALAASAGLGEELVVQIPSGNSGKGTFAIQTESDYRQVADQLETAKECRIMKALPSPQSFCLESVLTDAGMVIGLPALDLVGLPELTPNPDGWCGNVIGRGMIDPDLVRQMRESSFRIARALQRRHPDFFGYSGDDYLLASGSKQLIYQEKNARCTGMMPLSNIAARELGIPSLLVHHLLQYQGDCTE
jgi:biotin carboxylase